jgi:hypothetical protein
VLFVDCFVTYTAQIGRVVDFLQSVLNCFGRGVLPCSTGALCCFWYFSFVYTLCGGYVGGLCFEFEM